MNDEQVVLGMIPKAIFSSDKGYPTRVVGHRVLPSKAKYLLLELAQRALLGSVSYSFGMS